MKAYLNTTIGKVIYPPFEPTLETLIVASGTPQNDQLFFLNNGDDVIVYAPYDYFAALITKEEYEYLLHHKYSSKNMPQGMRYAKLYREEDVPIRCDKSFFAPSDVSIFLGDSCNLKCVYCNAVSYRKGAFDPEKTIEAFRIFVGNSARIEGVSFFGNGEPLLYFETIKRIIEIAKSNGIEKFYATTNGVLENYTDEIVNFLVQNGVETSISLDGYEAIQNLQRPTLGGAGSFASVMKTIRAFEKHGNINRYCYCRFTLTKQASAHLEEIVMFFYQLGFNKIRYAELIPEGAAHTPVGDCNSPPDSLAIVEPMVEAILLAESLGIDFTGDYDPRNPTNTGVHGCAYMAGSACAINENLELLICMEDNPEWVIGKVDIESSKIQIRKNRLEKIQKRNMLSLKECLRCPVKCGGGCTHYSYIKSGNLHSTGDYIEKCQSLQAILATYLSIKLKI